MRRRAFDGAQAVGEIVLTAGDVSRTYMLAAVPLGGDRIAWTGRDVTAERARESAMRGAVGHDPLTGLPDRATWRDRLEQALKRAARAEIGLGMMFIDLDAFKSVNDQHGHAFGDRVLIEVADRIRSVLRPADTLARLGGDEFIILCEGLPGVIELQRLGDRVAGAVSASPISALGQTASVTCSVGVTYARAGEMDIELFMRTADNAMYSAKRQGAGHTVVAEFERTSDRMTLGIQRAIEAGTLPMALQPVVDAISEERTGLTVDVRLGTRPHAAAALQSLQANPTTMRALAALAVRHALQALAEQETATVQVRLPMVAFTDHDFLRSMHRTIIDAGIDPARLILAVESAGARSERTLINAKESVDFELPLVLTKFGLHSVDLGALAELRPQICELDASLMHPAAETKMQHLQAACDLAHFFGARTQAAIPVDDLSDMPGGVDQVRKLPGETLQPVQPLSIGR
jgi:diguanylate cyclase (GGDEF)-like protein